MTGPGKISIGNVQFRRKDVQSYTVNFNENEKVNSVLLKNGTKLNFKDQDPKGLKSVSCGKSNENGEPYEMSMFMGIKGLSIEGSERKDSYNLYHCDDYNVDTRGGGKDKINLIDSTRGKVRADENDIVENGSLQRYNDNPTEYIKMDE